MEAGSPATAATSAATDQKATAGRIDEQTSSQVREELEVGGAVDTDCVTGTSTSPGNPSGTTDRAGTRTETGTGTGAGAGSQANKFSKIAWLG